VTRWISSLHPRGSGGKFVSKGGTSRAGRKQARRAAKQDRAIADFDAARRVTAGKRTKKQQRIIVNALYERDYARATDGGDRTRFSDHVEKTTGRKVHN
jgi:hypothetical protein